MTGSNFFSPPVNASSQGVKDTMTAIAVKSSLKRLFTFFYSLSRLFQLAYFVQMLANSPEVEAVQWTPTARKCLKKTFIKKGDALANSGLSCVLSVLFAPLGDMISLMKYPVSRQLYFASWFGGIFHLVVVLSEISKDDQNRIKWVYFAILFQIYTGVLSVRVK